jgi:hypothetical protein
MGWRSRRRRGEAEASARTGGPVGPPRSVRGRVGLLRLLGAGLAVAVGAAGVAADGAAVVHLGEGVDADLLVPADWVQLPST